MSTKLVSLKLLTCDKVFIFATLLYSGNAIDLVVRASASGGAQDHDLWQSVYLRNPVLYSGKAIDLVVRASASGGAQDLDL